MSEEYIELGGRKFKPPGPKCPNCSTEEKVVLIKYLPEAEEFVCPECYAFWKTKIPGEIKEGD